jgi:hypothetical protein
MTTVEDKPAAGDAAPLKMQFSLGTLLVLPVVVGCALAVLFTKPSDVAGVELLAIGLLLPAGLSGGIVYGKGYTRAFCIGALFPAGAIFYLCTLEFTNVLVAQAWNFNANSFGFQCLFGGGWLAAVISGCLCVGIRWLALGSAAADGSTRRHRWGTAIFVLVLALLILSGPIVGRIGYSLGWWSPDTPPPPGLFSLPPTTAPYSSTGYYAPSTAYPSTPPSPIADPSAVYDSSSKPSGTSPVVEPASPRKP